MWRPVLSGFENVFIYSYYYTIIYTADENSLKEPRVRFHAISH